ncbi:segregation/condensation protein A [Streptomyces sp. Ru73]|uniref:segregation and condensation protein A n=1 Tax=Streptomyces sp. Ru73 TaxID=2080748 RepID=UPI000CDDF4B7|nr:segregation/condensation protein A [Streptomyces sp. Ru73]POX36805.1 segregation/condensation protein A [Streptomyces sp. Ru73]
MPTTHDPSAPAPRTPRRSLGRGPGATPPPDSGPAPETTAPPEAGEPAEATAAPEPATAGPEDATAGPAELEPTETELEPAESGPEPTETGPEPAGSGAGAEGESGAGAEDAPEGGAGREVPAEPADATVTGDGKFTLHLENFEGPFDLLLQLISKHKLDVTEIALSKVTDEFMAHIRAMGPDWDLDQTTEFLVVAATLLDLKAARLLPAAEVEDEADLALLEARDLLFARLLQYRAYKEVADVFSRRLADEARRYPRTVGLEPHHAELLPEVVISIGAEGFAKLAVKAMQPKAKPQVYVDHIHAPLVSVREQAEVMVARLRAAGEASFQELTEDAPDTLTVVARFLALLELYRERAVVLDQPEALGELTVRWAGTEDGSEPVVTDEFDRPAEQRTDEKSQKETA